MTLMQRRRALMGAQPDGETWDYEWDFTMGKLEDQQGVNITRNGVASSSLSSDGEVITSSVGGYINLYFQEGDYRRTMSNGIGVMECIMKAHLVPLSDIQIHSQQNVRITIAQSSTSRLTICQSIRAGKWIILDNNNTDTDASRFADFQNDTWYKVRLEMRGTFAKVYINDELVLNNASLSSSLYGIQNSVMAQNMNSGTCTLKSLKLKIGRL